MIPGRLFSSSEYRPQEDPELWGGSISYESVSKYVQHRFLNISNPGKVL